MSLPQHRHDQLLVNILSACNGVAPRQRAVQADAKERGGEKEVEGKWNHLDHRLVWSLHSWMVCRSRSDFSSRHNFGRGLIFHGQGRCPSSFLRVPQASRPASCNQDSKYPNYISPSCQYVNFAFSISSFLASLPRNHHCADGAASKSSDTTLRQCKPHLWRQQRNHKLV